MRLLVAGGRDWTDTEAVYQMLDSLNRNTGIDVVIEGNAKGVDRIAGYWARRRRIDNRKFAADWKTHGKAAGPIRNQHMIDEGRPDLAVVYPGGRGTQDMRKRLEKAGIIRYEPVPLVGLDEDEARVVS